MAGLGTQVWVPEKAPHTLACRTDQGRREHKGSGHLTPSGDRKKLGASDPGECFNQDQQSVPPLRTTVPKTVRDPSLPIPNSQKTMCRQVFCKSSYLYTSSLLLCPTCTPPPPHMATGCDVVESPDCPSNSLTQPNQSSFFRLTGIRVDSIKTTSRDLITTRVVIPVYMDLSAIRLARDATQAFASVALVRWNLAGSPPPPPSTCCPLPTDPFPLLAFSSSSLRLHWLTLELDFSVTERLFLKALA